MSIFLKPAISLSNQLRFKAKFFTLASMFYLPLLACFLWIFQEQLSFVDQYELELFGQQKIQSVAMLERDIRATYSEPNSANQITQKLNKLAQDVKSHTGFTETSSVIAEIKKRFDFATSSEGIDAFETYGQVYEQTLALRENISALSGLSREGQARSFYLAEATTQRLPALAEYVSRTRDLTSFIIENGGFDAQSYTLLVALDKRIDEIQLQLQKTHQQLAKIAQQGEKSYLSQYQAFNEALDNYQATLHAQVIDPDEISLSLTQANNLGNEQISALGALFKTSDSLLAKNLQSLKSTSILYLWILSAVLIAVFIITSYLFIAIYHSLTTHVYSINQASERLGNGDFSETLCIDSKDELGDISRSFNQMQTKIHQLISGFNDDVSALRVAANDIHKLTENMEHSIAAQQQSTHSVVNAIGQVSASVNVINESTSGARDITETANKHVQEGQLVISETASAITDISEEVNQSASVINELAQYSSEIGQFVNVIREIADQTNLLALNAAIEAARAGEQGRGFAVVADEVRTLASRTQESTGEIQRIIEQLQLGANNSVEAMNRGVTKAEHGVDKTSQVATTFEEVTDNVSQIVSATVEISAAVDEQRQMVLDIDSSTAQIAQGADDVTQSAKDAAQAGENLSKLADNLSQQLAQFTLSR